MIMINQMSVEIQHSSLTWQLRNAQEESSIYEVHKMLLKYVNIHLKTIELLKISLQKDR